MTLGISFPRGMLGSTTDLRLTRDDGTLIKLQAKPSDRWHDGSVRWALLDLQIDAIDGSIGAYTLGIEPGGQGSPEPGLAKVVDGGVEVSTDRATFLVSVGGAFPISGVVVKGAPVIDGRSSGVQLTGLGARGDVRVEAVSIRETGPVRADLEVRGRIDDRRLAAVMEVVARVEIFANSAVARIATTIRNRGRARHPGGRWPLGDPGSVLIDAAVLRLRTGEPSSLGCAVEAGESLSPVEMPLEIYQESSGGEQWRHPVHRNRDGQVPLRFCGYRSVADGRTRTGARASPIIVADFADRQMSVAVPEFWQRFPSSVVVRDGEIEIGLIPAQAPEPCELQGGEQRTLAVTVAFAADTVSDPPLAWCHDPALVSPPPSWMCASDAVPFLVPTTDDHESDYVALVAQGLDARDGFVAKAERADEFGWRNFGDLVADHESAPQPPNQLFVSHYNNQYDAIAGFAIQWFRSRDAKWWHLMRDLARHVRDVDIYHTAKDKAAYNGGLFWHTLHYEDAGTSTHRSYPAGRPQGGGPSAEHNYAMGLMLDYFLTGDPASRDAAIELGRWVLAMDDGRLTPFRWLAHGPTGLASATGSPDYHGPGRGPANSIIACLVARRLTGQQIFGAKAHELIRRSIHPHDAIDRLNLDDTERRWSYTVLLQALGAYLDDAAEREALDDMFAYAQASLLAYADWMVDHESPYLDHPERLEFPNETWPAQDMRKAEVFWWAALHAAGADRDRFLERAQFFFRTSTTTLHSMPTRVYTRPIVLMLSNGYRFAWFAHHTHLNQPPRARTPPGVARPSRPFKPQKTRALRRLRQFGVAAVIALLVLGAWLAAR